jgi:hypothetical protein
VIRPKNVDRGVDEKNQDVRPRHMDARWAGQDAPMRRLIN